MLYRVRIDLAFDNPGAYTGLLAHALGILPQAKTINPGEINQEGGFIITETCYHDEDPNKPCEVIDEVSTS